MSEERQNNRKSVVFIGPWGVGKTSLISRYCKGIFEPAFLGATVGIQFNQLNVKVDEQPHTIFICDTAGSERYDSHREKWITLSKPDVVFAVFDISDSDSFDTVKTRIDEAKEKVPNATFILVGNKVDCDVEPIKGGGKEYNRQVTKKEAEECAREQDMPYYETSAKTGIGADEVFQAGLNAVYPGCTVVKEKVKQEENALPAAYEKKEEKLEKKVEEKKLEMEISEKSTEKTEERKNGGRLQSKTLIVEGLTQLPEKVTKDIPAWVNTLDYDECVRQFINVHGILHLHRTTKYNDQKIEIGQFHLFKQVEKRLRDRALDLLFDNIGDQKPSSQIDALNDVKQYDIFRLHRSSSFFSGGFGNTSAQNKIDEKIYELKQMTAKEEKSKSTPGCLSGILRFFRNCIAVSPVHAVKKERHYGFKLS